MILCAGSFQRQHNGVMNITRDNNGIEKGDNNSSEASDEGGEEQSPCSLPTPAGVWSALRAEPNPFLSL